MTPEEESAAFVESSGLLTPGPEQEAALEQVMDEHNRVFAFHSILRFLGKSPNFSQDADGKLCFHGEAIDPAYLIGGFSPDSLKQYKVPYDLQDSHLTSAFVFPLSLDWITASIHHASEEPFAFRINVSTYAQVVLLVLPMDPAKADSVAADLIQTAATTPGERARHLLWAEDRFSVWK